MRQTLFFIPHWVFEGPLLIAWLIIGALILALQFKKHGNSNEVWSFLPVYLIVAAAIHFVIPNLEIMGLNPADPTGPEIVKGVAVRGYGIFLLLGIVSGVAIVLMRCRSVGLQPDDILGLGFWMMVCGIGGARLFYVIQNSDDFFVEGGSAFETIKRVVNMTEGGLVVYGSLIGGTIAAVVYLLLNKLPMLKTADLIAPGMVLGLAIGRLGCLMNGCCFGGVCDVPLPAVTFPAGSAPYMQQLSLGDLVGLRTSKNEDASQFFLNVESVDEDSVAASLGLVAGDQVSIAFPQDTRHIRFKKENPEIDFAGKELVVFVDSQQKGRLVVPVAELPDRSLWTHPTQIYSSINAGLLCLVLWFYWTIKKSDGEVFALMLILYSIGRFLMELIRTDEPGQFGTDLTISQWVSIAMIVVGFALFAYARGTGGSAKTESPDVAIV